MRCQFKISRGGEDLLLKCLHYVNIAVRAPYMHDGRFSTLEEVVEHYSTGIKASPNLQRPLSARRQFNMADIEKKALVAFLKTLTDEKMLKDPKFSDPFVK